MSTQSDFVGNVYANNYSAVLASLDVLPLLILTKVFSSKGQLACFIGNLVERQLLLRRVKGDGICSKVRN